MRPIHEIAQDVHACASAWVPEARLVGNVRADEVSRLAVYAMAADLGLTRASTIRLVPHGVAALEARIAAGYAALQAVVEAARRQPEATNELHAAIKALDELAEPRRPTEGCSACTVGIQHDRCPTGVP